MGGTDVKPQGGSGGVLWGAGKPEEIVCQGLRGVNVKEIALVG